MGVEPELAAAGVRALLQLSRIDAIHHIVIGMHAARRIAVAAQRGIAAHDVGAGIEPGFAAGRCMGALDDLPCGQFICLRRHASRVSSTQAAVATEDQVPRWMFMKTSAFAYSLPASGSIRRISTATVNADTMCMNETIANTGV